MGFTHINLNIFSKTDRNFPLFHISHVIFIRKFENQFKSLDPIIMPFYLFSLIIQMCCSWIIQIAAYIQIIQMDYNHG